MITGTDHCRAFILQDRKRLPVRFFPSCFGIRLARLG
tara:strand:+ start:114 stop:224 length:111 start_codon:yes stop_codon:yes gene_type:complete